VLVERTYAMAQGATGATRSLPEVRQGIIDDRSPAQD
jgi:hypothetical protein